MLEFILLVMAVLGMAHRKGGYPSKGRYSLRPVRFAAGVALAALADKIVIGTGLTGVSTSSYRMISVQAVWSLNNHTDSEGPIVVGYAHSDYSVTEIKEAIEAGASIELGNKVSNEQANRLVRIVGIFNGDTTEEVLNDGRPIKTRLNWAIPIGDEVDIFAYNDSAATLTTGTLLNATGKCWVKDSL